jgi:hypothetical protein
VVLNDCVRDAFICGGRPAPSPPAQLDRGRQRAALLEGGTDRGGFSLSGRRMTVIDASRV